jgi:surface carbohydrate biosynthesis protein
VRSLILPCETRVREFDAKLLLGLLAASRGIPAIVGSKKSIDLELSRYPAGVYVGKSVTARSRHNLILARACGHRVALWDEEGLVWASREVYWRTKVDGPTLNEPELLLAWGEDNADAWREHPDYRQTPISVTGNPRADLLKPSLRALFDAEVEQISAEHGRFILINTNFSRVNHVQPRQNRHLKWLREQRPDDPRGGFAAHKYELFKAFSEAIPQLAKACPALRFVIRPHPSERRETWDVLAAGIDNLHIAQHGNVVAWLLAADGLVHNGCTTAVEAWQLGRPALAFRPVVSADYDHPLPNGISLDCPDFDSLKEQVLACHADRDALFTAQAQGERRGRMERALAGAGSQDLASEGILSALLPLLNEPGPPSGYRPTRASLALALRRLARPIEHRLPGTANYRPYLAHMFPDTTLAEVRARCERLAECLGMGQGIDVEQVGDNVFSLAGCDDHTVL